MASRPLSVNDFPLPSPRQVAREAGFDAAGDWGELIVEKLSVGVRQGPDEAVIRFRGLIGQRYVEDISGEDLVDVKEKEVLQWVGPVVTEPEAWTLEPPPWPCVRGGFLAEKGLALQAWHRAVWMVGRLAYAQLRWKPETGDRFSIIELEPSCPESDRVNLRARAQLLATFGQKRGRRRLTATQDRWRMLAERAEELKLQYPALSGPQIAARLGVPHGTLKRWRAMLAELRKNP